MARIERYCFEKKKMRIVGLNRDMRETKHHGNSQDETEIRPHLCFIFFLLILQTVPFFN